MTPVVRGLLWAAVILAPGGVALLPLLAAGSLRDKRRKTADVAPTAASR